MVGWVGGWVGGWGLTVILRLISAKLDRTGLSLAKCQYLNMPYGKSIENKEHISISGPPGRILCTKSWLTGSKDRS